MSLPIPTDLASFLDIVRQHGNAVYSIVFAYAASHSMLITLLGGFAAHAGALTFVPLIVACWTGSFLGDVIRFWIGRRYGTGLLRRFPKLERAIKVVTQLTDYHFLWMMLVHRYPHGVRGVAGFAYGMSNLSWGTFLLINLVASGIWAVTVASIGYGFGQFSEKALNDASSGLGIGMLIAFIALSWYLARRLDNLIEQQSRS